MTDDYRAHLTFWGTISVRDGFRHYCTTMDPIRWAQAAYHLMKVQLNPGERMIAYDLVTHREKDLAEIFGDEEVKEDDE